MLTSGSLILKKPPHFAAYFARRLPVPQAEYSGEPGS